MNRASINHHRNINPEDIKVPAGYKVEVFADELTTPINMIFTSDDQILLADAGVADGNGKVLRYTNGQFEVIADGYNPPLTGINYHNGNIYVSHRGKITTVNKEGKKKILYKDFQASEITIIIKLFLVWMAKCTLGKELRPILV